MVNLSTNYMKRSIGCLLICFIPTLHADTYPEGWQPPTNNQYSKSYQEIFNHSMPNKIIADFNGDNISDAAWILANTNKTKFALFVSLNKENKKPIFIKLTEDNIGEGIYMGISALTPGTYKTACGKGYWDCDKNETPSLKLENTGINFFKFESASSVYFWVHKENLFKQIWLSD